MTNPSDALLELLNELNGALLQGILADLRAPELLEETGDADADAEALKSAQARARMARVSAEAALRRHNVTGIMQTEKARALQAAVAGKLDFSGMPRRPAVLPPAPVVPTLADMRLSPASPAADPVTPDGDEPL